jgi:hypothetical protein
VVKGISKSEVDVVKSKRNGEDDGKAGKGTESGAVKSGEGGKEIEAVVVNLKEQEVNCFYIVTALGDWGGELGIDMRRIWVYVLEKSMEGASGMDMQELGTTKKAG